MYVCICITGVSDCDCICYMISEQAGFLGYGGDCVALVYRDDNELSDLCIENHLETFAALTSPETKILVLGVQCRNPEKTCSLSHK